MWSTKPGPVPLRSGSALDSLRDPEDFWIRTTVFFFAISSFAP
jgi:hypothetical protein